MLICWLPLAVMLLASRGLPHSNPRRGRASWPKAARQASIILVCFLLNTLFIQYSTENVTGKREEREGFDATLELLNSLRPDSERGGVFTPYYNETLSVDASSLPHNKRACNRRDDICVWESEADCNYYCRTCHARGDANGPCGVRCSRGQCGGFLGLTCQCINPCPAC
jgi:hypothetical protein